MAKKKTTEPKIVPPTQALKSLQAYHEAVAVLSMTLTAILPQMPDGLIKDSIQSQLDVINYFYNPVEKEEKE